MKDCHFCTLTPALPTVSVYVHMYCRQSVYTYTCTSHGHCILTPVLPTVTVCIHLYCPVTVYSHMHSPRSQYTHTCAAHSHCILTPVLPTVTVYSHLYFPQSLYTHTCTAHSLTVCLHLYCPVTVYLYLYCPQSLYIYTCTAHSHCIRTPVLPTVTVYLHLTSIVTVLCWSLPSASQLYSPESLQRTGLMLWTNVDNRLSAVSIVWKGSSPSFRMWILLWGLPSCHSQRTWTPGSLFSSTSSWVSSVARTNFVIVVGSAQKVDIRDIWVNSKHVYSQAHTHTHTHTHDWVNWCFVKTNEIIVIYFSFLHQYKT